MTTPMDTRPCPFCAETILAAAIKCKHCSSDLAGRSMLDSSGAHSPPSVRVVPPKPDKLDAFESRMAYVAGVLILLLPVGAIALWIALTFMTRDRPAAALEARGPLRKGFFTGLAVASVPVLLVVVALLSGR